MKWIQTTIIIGIFSIIFSLLILLLYNMIKSDRAIIEERNDRGDALVGELVSIGTDTLTIMNYDVMEDSYTLSNYQTVSYIVVSKNVITR